MVIGLNLQLLEIELLLSTMLNTKKLLNQPIDSLLMICPLKTTMFTNKSTKNGLLSKENGSISTWVTLTPNKPLPVICSIKPPMKSNLSIWPTKSIT